MFASLFVLAAGVGSSHGQVTITPIKMDSNGLAALEGL
jgi:fructose/tagatose bisphosphate aldolase